MKRQHTFGISVLLFLAVGIMSGCGGNKASSDMADPAGEYALVSVAGNDVPADVSHQGVSIKVVSGTFSINADGTCRSKTTFQPPNGDAMDREVTATYTQEGPQLTMQWEGAGTTVGTLDGDTFTMDNEGMVFVYKK